MFKPELPIESIKLQEIIDFRFNQISAERLAEYITGMRFDNPDIVERLITDQKIFRAKYHLPLTTEGFGITNYDRFLRRIAKENDVLIKNTSDCGIFFTENSNAGGVYFKETNQIGVDIDDANYESYGKSLSVMQHELIHALQRKYYPRMPIEIREYEAYIACGNFDSLKDYSGAQGVLSIFFSNYLLGSINHWYKEESDKKGAEVKPEWDSPYYFLEKIDKLDPAKIEDVRLSKSE
ncbi:MAG: hypothetical protein WCO09_05135 [bacterium]